METTEQKIIQKIDENRDAIIEVGEYIWRNAELGFKEIKTSQIFIQVAKKLDMHVETDLAVTGVKARFKENDPAKPTIALICEMDALPFAGNPEANPQTGAAHFCGHNAQMAGVMGAMMALADPTIRATLDGNLVFMAVPAEEYVEVEFKNTLREKGIIAYGGGKCELIRVGAFDDVDIAIGHHILPGNAITLANASTNGFVNKIVHFHGKAAHAALSPESGVDALSAASLAMHAVDQQRESFRDQDSVRVHGYVSNGGEAMNIIADDVAMEYSVRAKTVDAMLDANKKFDRSMKAGALANGCDVIITTLPGYLPTVPATHVKSIECALNDVAAICSYPVTRINAEVHTTGSTDFGDLSSILPLLQFNTGGYSGQLHDSGLRVTDPELAYVITAKLFALTAFHLLNKKHALAKELMNDFQATFSKESYLAYMDNLQKTEKFAYNSITDSLTPEAY